MNKTKTEKNTFFEEVVIRVIVVLALPLLAFYWLSSLIIWINAYVGGVNELLKEENTIENKK